MNGTKPSAIPANIQKMSTALTGSEVNDIPSLDYVRKCRVFVQSLNNLLPDCRLRKVDNWHQIFTYGITWSQIKFQNLLIGFMKDGDFESVIAS